MAARRPGEYIGERIVTARKDRGWTQAELAKQLERLGPHNGWRQSKIAKIENGAAKKLALDDVLALAVALGVAPAYLLSPPEEGDVEVAPKLVCSAPDFRRWLRGEWPLEADSARNYYFGALVPDSEWKRYLSAADEAGELVLTPSLLGGSGQGQ
jgi:transcriptional regulator with XRE-family HTH domain